MKKLTLPIALLLSTVCLSQIEFAPIGAKWTYEITQKSPQNNTYYSYFIFESKKDTILQNKNCRIIEAYTLDHELNGNVIRASESNQIIVQDGYKIYHYFNNEFNLLFDFSLQKNENLFIKDAWNILLKTNLGFSTEFLVKNRMTDFKANKPQASLELIPNCFEAFSSIKISEIFGSTEALFIYGHDICRPNRLITTKLHCYSDPNVGTILLGSYPCDQILKDKISNSIQVVNQNTLKFYQDLNGNSAFILLPNSTESPISIKFISSNGTMKNIPIHNVQSNLYHFDLRNLPTGLYIVRAIDKSNNIYTTRFLKQ